MQQDRFMMRNVVYLEERVLAQDVKYDPRDLTKFVLRGVFNVGACF